MYIFQIFGKGDDADQNASALLVAVLDTLTKIFIYDSVNFVNQERFHLIVKPLADQVKTFTFSCLSHRNF